MVRLDDIEIFLTVSKNGSFSAASRELEISNAVASAAVKRLEKTLNAQLLVRTTRSLSLTQVGSQYLEYAQSALSAIKQGESAIAMSRGEISGRLSISLPSDLGRGFLRKTIDIFQSLHPKLEIKLMADDRISDLYKSPVDAAIRYGMPSQSNLYASTLVKKNYRVVCASPKYFKQYGKPVHPEDLGQHNCLCFMLNNVVHNKWQFGLGKKTQIVAVKGNKISDDGDMVRQWAVDGNGIAYKSKLDVLQDIRDGKLEIVLENYSTEHAPLNLMTSQRVSLSPATNTLLIFLLDAFRAYLK